MLVCFLKLFLIDLFARLMHVFLNHILVMCSLIWKQNIYLEQMDSFNTGISYEFYNLTSA